MDKKQILVDLSEKYSLLKEELGLSMSLEDLDLAFSIKDGVLFDGFVGEKFSKQLCSKISERFSNWIGYLNILIMPNPGFLPSSTESKIFSSDEDRKLIWDLIKNLMKFTSMNSLIILKGDESLEKEFLENSYSAWNNYLKPKLEGILQRAHSAWKGN